MIVRLMAEDKIIGMYDELIKVGMPGAERKLSYSKRKVSPTGAEYSIETPHVFYQRVRSYMDMIFNRSMDIDTEVRYADGSTELIRSGVLCGEYRFASFENRGRAFDTDPTDFADLDAALAAEEILVRFGVRTASAGQKLTEIEFPDGSVAYGPKAIADEIEGALARTAGIGSAYNRKAQRILSTEEFGFPYEDIPQKQKRIQNYSKVANFINGFVKFSCLGWFNQTRRYHGRHSTQPSVLHCELYGWRVAVGYCSRSNKSNEYVGQKSTYGWRCNGQNVW